VAYIRKVRTASGATAVQIAEYADGRERVVEHVGSAHTVAELGVLLERARERLVDPAQEMFDFEVDQVAPTARLMSAPAEPTLLEESPRDELRRGGSVERAGTGQVVGTASALLFDALAGVFTDLGFDAVGDPVGDPVFRDLVLARIVEPTSLLDTGRVLSEMGRTPAAYATMKRTLARCTSGRYRDQIASLCFTHAVSSGDVSLCLYDVTTLYFEAEKEDTLRKVGYSKERRVDPQIVVGLLVDRRGFPLEIGCFEGDKAETLTIVPIVKQFAARHDLAHMVVVADAGMLSTKNLDELAGEGLFFIVGSRATKAPIDLESHFRWHGDAFSDGQVIDTITPKNSAGETAARTPRFVKTSNGTRSLDQAALTRARRLVGLKGYVTNIPASLLPPSEVIGSYHDLWHVEASFRMSKTDLAARPMFARKRDAIEAHLTVVFTALAVAREAQNRSGMAIRNLVRRLRVLRSATIAINGVVQTFPPAISPEQQSILDALTAAERHPLTE
jgi:hypothetical protein